jgi:hypothetical protein
MIGMPAMFLLDLLGAVLTLITLLFLFLDGYLVARALLRERAESDPLALAIGSLLAATTLGVGIGLVLGGLGLLRAELALLLVTVGALLPLSRARRGSGGGVDLWAPIRLLGRRLAERVRESPILSLIAGHAVFAEDLRGLVRPPLSWDSIMYHLLITATWLQERRIAPVFGMHPTYFYGFNPSNGSVWLWWWMAPSHSELYANLAFFPHTILLALAAGGIARELGARRQWPYASFLVLLIPTVIRFTATQYVDVFLASAFAAAAFFAIHWLRQPRWSDAALAGAGLGIAAGSKVLGIPYALALAGTTVLLARGDWKRRLPQLAAAVALLALLGGYFYAQNVIYGAGPLAARCEGTVGAATGPAVPHIPRINTVAWMLIHHKELTFGSLLDVFLGVPRDGSDELGVGPQLLLLLPALLLLPWLVPKGVGEHRGNRRAAVLVWSQVLLQLFVWSVVPYGSSGHVFANVRYLDGALALLFAGSVAVGARFLSDAAFSWLTLILAIQSLLQLHTEMPRTVRVALALADIAMIALAIRPGLRAAVRRRSRELILAAVVLALLAAPWLAAFRVYDRERAFATEYTAHKTTAFLWAPAWGWLDRNGENGTVAIVGSPSNFFVYPVMGAHLERKAIYANVNRQDYQNAALYPGCDPRVEPDPQAWLENLVKHRVRWVYLDRFPQTDFPMEQGWIAARPDLFVPRFVNNVNVIYEFLPGAPGWKPPTPR